MAIKNILFIAHPYKGLYKIIEQELIDKGFTVTTLIESQHKRDPYHITTSEKKKRNFEKKQILRKYWIEKIATLPELHKKYEIIFCIQGCTIEKTLIEHLMKYNPEIKKILYIWDSNKYYDFLRNAHLFDKCFTFDKQDAKEKNIFYLPFFWPKEIESLKDVPQKYDFCHIGSNHDDRISVLKKLIDQFKNLEYSYYIRIIVKSPEGIKGKIKIFLSDLLPLHWKNRFEFIELYGKKKLSFICYKSFSPYNFNKLLAQSKCIIDTERPIQYALTPRVIWAIACKKKIITTNINIIKLLPEFSSQIQIVDRKNPKLDKDFINSNFQIGKDAENIIESLRIDKWLDNILKLD